jgi:hypothetical protein
VLVLLARLLAVFVEDCLHVLRKQFLRVGVVGLHKLQQSFVQLPDMQLGDRLSHLLCGLRHQWFDLRPVQLPHFGLHQLHFSLRLHELCQRLPRFGVGRLSPLQLPPHGLPHVRLRLGLQHVHGGVRH